jgi:lipopolysaccharide/colanic/teichoic acid biosynthesis glycosyltransferase
MEAMEVTPAGALHAFNGRSTQGNDSPMLGNLRPPDPRPRLSQRMRAQATKSRVEEVPVPVTAYLWIKRIVDIVLATVLAILLAPVVAVMAIIVAITSRGPAFYTQVRLGRLGKPFVIWKLRTMQHNCEDETGAKWSGPGDQRVTPIGRVLRKLHIDEFPQLWNVLRGEMSLVGPRPERPEFFPVLSAEIPHYSRRLLVKPGVTGLAQVYLPPDEDVADVRRKQIHDLYYIGAIGAWLDMRILIATTLQSIGLPHCIVRPMLLLPKRIEIEGPDNTTPAASSPRISAVENISPEPISQTVT